MGPEVRWSTVIRYLKRVAAGPAVSRLGGGECLPHPPALSLRLQLVQQAAMEATSLAIWANQIEVSLNMS
jgi:hypothetical protein